MTLADGLNNYSFIVVQWKISGSNSTNKFSYFPASLLSSNAEYYDSVTAYNNGNYINSITLQINSYTQILFKTEFHTGWGVPKIYAVYGLK